MLTAREELEHEVSPHYWEINDRGANFSYLPPERRAKLGEVFSLIALATLRGTGERASS